MKPVLVRKRPETPARRQPLRVSLLTGALTVVALLAPLIGAGVAVMRWNGLISFPVRPAAGTTLGGTLVEPAQDPRPHLANFTSTEPVGIMAGGFRGGTWADGSQDAWLLWLGLGSPVLAGLLVGVVLLLLIGVVRGLARGRVLDAGTAWRLHATAAVLAGGSLLQAGLAYLGARRLLTMPYVDPTHWDAAFRPAIWPFGLAALLVLLGLSIRAGARLREETEGLV